MFSKLSITFTVQLLTKRVDSAELDPHSEVFRKDGRFRKSIFEVLQETHPPQRTPDPRAFLDCDELPTLEHVDITAAHIKTVARHLSGSAGSSSTDSEKW